MLVEFAALLAAEDVGVVVLAGVVGVGEVSFGSGVEVFVRVLL